MKRSGGGPPYSLPLFSRWLLLAPPPSYQLDLERVAMFLRQDALDTRRAPSMPPPDAAAALRSMVAGLGPTRDPAGAACITLLSHIFDNPGQAAAMMLQTGEWFEGRRVGFA